VVWPVVGEEVEVPSCGGASVDAAGVADAGLFVAEETVGVCASALAAVARASNATVAVAT
jgi:hypothetical protein